MQMEASGMKYLYRDIRDRLLTDSILQRTAEVIGVIRETSQYIDFCLRICMDLYIPITAKYIYYLNQTTEFYKAWKSALMKSYVSRT